MTVEVVRIVARALSRLNVYASGASIKDADAETCVDALNEILDGWNAERQAIYVDRFTSFVTTPALQPHTIGPTGVWVVPQRPVSIEGAAWLAAPGTYTPFPVTMDPRWWQQQSSYASPQPIAAYYAPSLPNGELYFIGAPNGAITIRLLTRYQFTAVALIDTLELPQGYYPALTLTLMEAVSEDFGKEISAKLAMDAGKARARIFGNNLRVRPLRAGAGVPGLSRGFYDYRTGTFHS